MITVVAVSDTHSCHNQLIIPDGDIFIHAGDLTHIGTVGELTAVAKWMRELPHKHKIVIAGNHDFLFQDHPEQAQELFEGLTYLQDREVIVEGLRVYGSPWQPWFHDWAFNLRRGKEILEKWKLIPKDLDILVTHGPPLGFGDRVNRLHGDRVGDEDLFQQIQEKKPRYHIFGHIHEDRGMWIKDGITYINVASNYGAHNPIIIDIENK